MTDLNTIYAAIARNVKNNTEIRTAHDFRPRSFNANPLFYLDVPTISQTRMGRGVGQTPMTAEVDAVVIVSTKWQDSAQSKLRELMPPVMAALRLDLGIADTSIYVGEGRGLRPGQYTEDGDGLPVGPVGAVWTIRIETKL